MKEKLKSLFVTNYDSPSESHIMCILKIYALVGTGVHLLFALLHIIYGFYGLAAVELIYLIFLFSSLFMYKKVSINIIAFQVLLSTSVLIVINILYLGWSFGYYLYILLLVPILVYLKYKGKYTLLVIDIFYGLFFMFGLLYSTYWGYCIIETPRELPVIFETINITKVFLSLYLYMYITKFNTDTFINKLNADKDLLDKDSKIDHLTGLYNRRSMEKFLNTLVDQYHITNKTFGMVLLDIDFFKKVNDTYGHLAGDKVLAEISRLVVYTLRKSDSVFRYGGEEFLAIIPGVQNKKEALEIANGIRQDVEQLNIDIDGKDINVTISCGVTLYDGLDMAANIQRVDDALYKSKNNGRNRAEFL